MKNRSVTVVSLVIGCSLFLGGGVFAVIRHLSQSTIPAAITREVNFVLFYPKTGSVVSIEQSSFKYDSSLEQLSFVVLFKGSKLTFAEQATPQSFYVSPDYYNKLVTNLGGYYTFQNSEGKIDIAKDPSIGHEVGVMNSKGTLLFINSSNPLSDDDWREVFGTMTYVQTG